MSCLSVDGSHYTELNEAIPGVFKQYIYTQTVSRVKEY